MQQQRRERNEPTINRVISSAHILPAAWSAVIRAFVLDITAEGSVKEGLHGVQLKYQSNPCTYT